MNKIDPMSEWVHRTRKFRVIVTGVSLSSGRPNYNIHEYRISYSYPDGFDDGDDISEACTYEEFMCEFQTVEDFYREYFERRSWLGEKYATMKNSDSEVIGRGDCHLETSFDGFDYDQFRESRTGFDKFFEPTEKKMEEANLPLIQKNRIGLTAWMAWKAGIEFSKKGDK